MFDSDKEYLAATRHAQVNTYEENTGINNKLIMIILLMTLALSYIGFMYLKTKTDLFPSFSMPTAVLGVSETVESTRDEEYLKELTNSMTVLMNESSIKSQSSYTEAIARELDDKSQFKGRIVVVKKGDTLSNLSEKFYGNSREFSKIINSNDNLKEGSYLLKIGQSINIPY